MKANDNKLIDEYRNQNSNKNVNVICDTCVWYDLGKTDPVNIDNKNLLTGTLINLCEISYSQNLNYKKEDVMAACSGIKKYAKEIIKINPWDYLISFVDESFQSNTVVADQVISDMNYCLKYGFAKVNNEDAILNYSNAKSYLSDYINSALPNIRHNIKALKDKNIHKKFDNNNLLIIELINSLILDYTDNTVNLKEIKFDWNLIECFIKVWSIYVQRLELCFTSKVQDDHWNDLFNFIYVKPDDKYLTFDRYWINLVQQNNKDVFNKYFLDVKAINTV